MSVKQNYLDNVPWGKALFTYLANLEKAGALKPGPKERLSVAEARGRVTASPVFAQKSSPHYNAAAMDGIAVRSEDTYGAAEVNPVRLRLGFEAQVVDTGDPLPEGYNAVIMVEDINFSEETAEIIAPAVPWQHVRVIGEDFVETEMVLPSHQQIRPVDIGGLLTAGVTEIDAYPKPRVAIIPTGTELVAPGDPLEPGSIIESNSKVLGSLVEEWGGKPIYGPATPDDYQLLKKVFLEYLEKADMLAVIAGSSAGREDFTCSIFQELGEVFIHGVAIRPGKPVILGTIQGKPVIGVPGYPVSANLTFELFAKPVLYQKQGLPVPERPSVRGTVGRKLASPLGAEEFVRVRIGQVRGKIYVQPLPRGAGSVTSLIKADGVVRVPCLSEGYPPGTEVDVELLRPWQEIEKTTVVVGSHDLVLDIIADFIQRKRPGHRLISSHVGSMGGLTAIARGEAHLAGTHLLDEETGNYNITFAEKILDNKPFRLVNLSYRIQGFIVPPGNPKGIKKLLDLTREDVRFINRQRGSGTRLLLDYLLRKEGISPDAINGYGREEYTHMAVAVAVASGSVDVGLGIQAAADALKLDFVPIGEERYDLCIPAALWDTEEILMVRELFADAEFLHTIKKLRGYDFRDLGKVFAES